MDTRQIQAEMAKLQKILDQQQAEEAKVKQKAEAERKAAVIREIKEINETWDGVCDKQNLKALQVLLQKLEKIADVAVWDVREYYEQPNKTSHRYVYSDESSSGEETFPLSHVHNQYDRYGYHFKPSLLRYAMRSAIINDNDSMLSMVLELYIKHYCEQGTYGLEHPIHYPEGDSYKNNIILPLIYAILKKSEKCALLLVEKGADPNAMHFAKASFCGAALNQSELLATALGLAIEHGLTSLAKKLIEKGAAIGGRYIEQLKDWERSQCYHHGTSPDWLAKSFDQSMTPFLLAAKYNNLELIEYLMNKGVNIEVTNSKKQSAVDLTTDSRIKALLLASYSLNTRLERVNYQGAIPAEIKCAVSGKIMERPAVNHEGQHFCKHALVEKNKRQKDWTGLNNKKIDMKTYIDLLSLPDDKSLENQCRQFVEKIEEQTAQAKRDNAMALLQGKGKKR